MIHFTREHLKDIFHRVSQKKILVVGDMMLDRYLWGDVSKISPEAPVPVVDVTQQEERLGGASNVAYNVMTLGARVVPVGVIGRDRFGEQLTENFHAKGFETGGLIVAENRPTTAKTRVIAHNQHVVRIDREVREDIDDETSNRVLAFIRDHLPETDAVILEDYNKGLLTPDLIRSIVKLCRKIDIPVLVDPKYDHFFEYQHVTLFKPNRKEVSDKLGMRLTTDEEVEEAGQELLSRMKCDSVLITLGAEGMALFQTKEPWIKIPTRAVKVHDVSGAGDTVIATIAVTMSSGATWPEAITLANQAAGIVCGEVGIVPIEKETLIHKILHADED